MITKVKIKNFQSHKNTEVEFAPNTNVIIGESDSGKSSIFRAINWVITNRPLGDAFRSEWGGDTEVSLYTTEGNIITRIRSDTKNEYHINENVIKAFGTEVPEEVEEILQLDSANIQSQRDLPFLLANTPGEAARMLNKAASIDDIDHALSHLKSSYTRIGNNIKSNEEKLENYQEELEQYDNIPDIEERLQQIEKQEKEQQQKRESVERLQKTSHKITEVETELAKMKKIPQMLKKYECISERFAVAKSQKENLCQLKQTVRQIKSVRVRLASTARINETRAILDRVDDKYQGLFEQKQKLKTLRTAYQKAKGKKLALIGTRQMIEALENKFQKLVPETCPLCGNPMEGGNVYE